MQSLALPGAVHNACQRREMAVSTNNGLVNGEVHNLLMQFFTPGSSKIEVSETCFFYILTTQNDHPSYVKHVLGRITCFSPYLGIRSGGGGWGLPRDGCTTCLCSFFTADSSKIEVYETCFFDIVTTQNDHPSYVKHVLGPIYVFFTYLGIRSGGGGGASRGLVHNLLMQLFTPDSSKIEVFETCFSDIVIT